MILLELFGAAKIPLSSVAEIEKNAPPIIVWAVPFMLFFSILELAISYYGDKGLYEKKETIGSVLVGLGNLIVSALIKTILILPIVWIYNAIPWRMELNWWTMIPCYIIYDLASYWAHRISHEQRFWWATHVAHHSGEDYNFTTSFRLSWVQHIKIVFFLPVMLLGFHPIIFFVTNQIAVLYQFWLHTELIGKLPRWISFIFVTPSAHRVHHGSQPQYIDKNYGASFMVWDHMFGTFEPEVEKVRYGITTNIANKANPFYINFHEYMDIWKDLKSAKGFRKKWFYIFGSPVAVAEEKIRLDTKRQAGVEQVPVEDAIDQPMEKRAMEMAE